MKVAALPANETARLTALHHLDVLDTPPEAAFDDITALAAHACKRPTALVSLVDADRQWFKSRWGLDATENPRDVAFCAHTILEPDRVMVVPDAHLDERFADNPLVTGDPNVRFYAGVPLVTVAGEALGTLCVLDTEAGRLTTAEAEALQALARRTVAQLELRRADVGRLRTELADAFHQITVLETDAIRQAEARAALGVEQAFREVLIERVAEGVAVCHPVPTAPFLEFTTWNQRMIEITGFGMAEINRLGLFECLFADSDSRRRAKQRMLRLEAGEEFQYERCEISRADGTKRVLGLTTSHLTLADGREHVLTLINDVTDEERVEREALRSRKDELTGLKTRHVFREEAEMIFGLAARNGAPSAMGFLDLDDLKVVNDTMGHLVGDRMLECVGATLSESTRSTDIVGRLGGDEFAVLLPETDAENAAIHFDRLHRRIADALTSRGWPAGVSVGVAFFPVAPPDLDAALNFADTLMYEAKRSGKNRVVRAEFGTGAGADVVSPMRR